MKENNLLTTTSNQNTFEGKKPQQSIYWHTHLNFWDIDTHMSGNMIDEEVIFGPKGFGCRATINSKIIKPGR